jgi:hypothetical protein
VEELYDTKNDIDEVNNLAGNPEYSNKLNEMRRALNSWQEDIPDVCLLPEGEIYNMQEKYNMPVADYLTKNNDYYQRVRETANQALFPEDNIKNLMEALNDSIPAVRYWAIRGIGRLDKRGKSYHAELEKLMNDPAWSVKASLAWALSEVGMSTEAIEIYREIFTTLHEDRPGSDNIFYTKVLAVNDLTYNKEMAKNLEKEIREIAGKEKYILRQAAENVLVEME